MTPPNDDWTDWDSIFADEEQAASGGGNDDQKKKQKKKRKRRIMGIWLGSTFATWFVFCVIVIAPAAVVMQVVLGNDFNKFVAGGACTADGFLKKTGLKKSKSDFCEVYQQLKKELGEDGVNELKDEIDDDLRAILDCSNATAKERAEKNCIQGLIKTPEEAQAQSPVPPRAEWLVPVWQAAADKYKVPWELVAAVNGARTNFGLKNCDTKFGVGFYRIDSSTWSEYGVDGGETKLDIKKDSKCQTSAKPAKYKKDGRTSSYDAVDAAFTQARILAKEGARDKTAWDYKGSEPGQCVPDPKREGTVFVMPLLAEGGAGAGARIGYNKNLEISPTIAQLAAKYRSDTGKWKPARTFSGQASMPQEDVRKILREAWSAFGVSGGKLDSNVSRNMAQIARESGFRPQVLQGYIGDVNDNNPAGGLVQFIPGTFNTWAVSGFNDRFNPLDNILAAVNAQVNSSTIYGAAPDGILDGRSGWSPVGGNNPYKTGGKSKIADSDKTSSSTDVSKPKAYSGKDQNDAISKAVAYNGETASDNSECYVALVHEWYEGIKANPPSGDGSVGPGPKGSKTITGGGKIVPIPGFPGESIDKRLLPDIKYMVDKYDIWITDGFATAGHSANGEHPIGAAIDLGAGAPKGNITVPDWGGDWKKIDALTKAADPKGWNVGNPNLKPPSPFRWVGYDGDGGTHGSPRKNPGWTHLHISWEHAPAAPGTTAKWVRVWDLSAKEDE